MSNNAIKAKKHFYDLTFQDKTLFPNGNKNYCVERNEERGNYEQSLLRVC